jgi:uncharacterized protein (DUF983 family)
MPVDIVSPAGARRSLAQAMCRGFAQACPACGEGRQFKSYLKVVDACEACGEELHHHRADDAPPYFTITIVGHVIVAGVLMVEDLFAPPSWVHALLWIPLILGLSLLLLPRIKGALVGLQWAFRMHGFAGKNVTDAVEYEPRPADATGA